ncbi:PH domain containing protein [Acanthamoeba castellanii str. Neff]|uniref:PH domain containing protein n=1 Tax=Acanthamoeba castellanii (strain ATCC 30010 / Neff) TaxID=1257118 RepID=L8H656_ACACF|nr:PH domain containing protein [Acanthamoeba castellanii str. Neff]ELR19961.1 PH domain containing protein [Acanthamoeba castellanii str. Neff]
MASATKMSQAMRASMPITKEGYLVKQGGLIRNWKKRWFVLKGNHLFYYPDRTSVEPSGTITLDADSKVNDGAAKTGRNDSLEIVAVERTFYVYSEEPSEMHEWQEVIAEAIDRLNGITGRGPNHSRPSFAGTPTHKMGKNESAAAKDVSIVVRGMLCECCEKKVKAILSVTPGIEDYKIEMEEEKVKIKGAIDTHDLLGFLEEAGFLPTLVPS